jgi:malonate-semialdehyde dehydrogenase (acetylating) / methylmalonate-semialdehyde dehydrogenase
MELQLPDKAVNCCNWIAGTWSPTSELSQDVLSPYTGKLIGRVSISGQKEVALAVGSAKEAQLGWAVLSIKDRTQVMFRFREILNRDLEEISHTIASESGKLIGEAKAGLLKGIEVLEFAISLQNLDAGQRMEVSRGVFCEERREPLGVVVGITPFNFPAMVPMWMMPIAITLGNSFVWKPSEKTPLTSLLIAKAFEEAGLPAGVLTIVQGGKETVESLCDHSDVSAVAFVGSTAVARSVYQRVTHQGKRALCLGGAKNHIILMPDAEPEIAAQGIASSYTGCAGQRCMAASVLLAVGETDGLIQDIKKTCEDLVLGKDIGAIISKESLERLEQAIDEAEKAGAKILLDGRKAKRPAGFEGGYWLGPTILDQVSKDSAAAKDELFGPILSIVRCKNLSEAIEIENQNPYGNAASVFTRQGAVAEEVAKRARSGMVGVNIGVPVPREPFSFGGVAASKFGHGDITGRSSLDFWTDLKKITMKWNLQKDQNWMS